jgi:hypothetical protein
MDTLKSAAKRLSIMSSKPNSKETSKGDNTAPDTKTPDTDIASKDTTKMDNNAPIASRAIKPSTSSMIELAAIITKETEKLEKYLKESGSPTPGFDVNSPANFPKLPEDMKKAREEIMRATTELGDLVTGPTESVRWMAWDHNNSLSLHAIYRYKIGNHI